MKFRLARNFSVILIAAVLSLSLSSCKQKADGTPTVQSTHQSANPVETASLVLKNAYVYTVDPSRRVAEAVAIKGNTILFVGSNEEVAALVRRTDRSTGSDGAMVMPGIHDMHIHALGTVAPEMCDLDSQTYSLEELVPVLQECIVRYDIAPGEWLIVLQWNFSENNRPSELLPNMRAALDAVSLEHPVFLWGNDGHHGAANSAAFAQAKNGEGQVIGMNAETLKGEFAEFQPMVAVDENGRPSGGINESARMLVRADFMGDFLGANA